MDSAGSPARPDLEAVRQRRSTLRASMEHLRQALAAAAAESTDSSCGAVSAAARELQARLAAHIEATEGPDGFHHDMLTAAPRLAHGVATLVLEHTRLTAMVSELMARSGREGAAEDIEAIEAAGARLVGAVNQHLQRGSDLIYEAFESDLGGQD